MPRTTLLALLAIAAIALALRLAWIANTDTETPVLSDPQYYHATASNLAAGRGYNVELDQRGFVAGDDGEGTAFWAPGYSALIAVPYAFLSDDIRWAKLVNALAGAIAVVPTFFIAAQLFPLDPDRGREERRRATAGLIAAAIVAFMPALVYWTPVLFADGVFMLGVASTIAVAWWARDRGGWWRALLCGIALAATVFVRSQGVLVLVPVAVLLVPGPTFGPAMRAMAPVLVALLVTVGLWTIRNDRVMGRPFLVSDNVCYNLRGAHAPYATGTTVAIQDLWDEAPGISFKERELLFDDLGCDRAWDYAQSHPRRELELAPKRVGWLLRSDAAPAMRWSETLGATPIDRGDRDLLVLFGDIAWYSTLAAGLFSPLVVARSRMAFALWSFIGAWLAMHLVFHGEPRYHLALVPTIAPLAAAVMVEAFSRLRSPERSGARGADRPASS